MYSKLVIMCLMGTLGLGTVTAQDPDQESSKSSTIIIKRVITGEDGTTRVYRIVDGAPVPAPGEAPSAPEAPAGRCFPAFPFFPFLRAT